MVLLSVDIHPFIAYSFLLSDFISFLNQVQRPDKFLSRCWFPADTGLFNE
tara:strand:- start:159036 stop:159185 length:150 start_codon:yes stop_codon:yes gene_type:complete